MRILYIIPRYHTNLVPAIDSLINAGHEVKIITHKSDTVENHGNVIPDVLGYGRFSEKICGLGSHIIPRKKSKIKKYFGSPPIKRFINEVISFKPDLMVLRSGYVYPIVSMLIAKHLDSTVLFYDQRPKYGDKNQMYNRQIGNFQITKLVDVIYKQIWNHSPVRVTPVRGTMKDAITDKNAYYIPFVKKVNKKAYTREYAPRDTIRIITVGRLHSSRKRHIMLLKSINKLRKEYNISLTIIGTANEFNEYANKISEYIYDNDLGDVVDIYWNLDYKKLQQSYINHDLFVLPTSYDSAAVSHLEAMANGLSVISTTANGTSNYIKDNENGYVIPPDDRKALTDKIEKILSDEKNLRKMGETSLKLVEENHSPDLYEERLMNAMKDANTRHS